MNAVWPKDSKPGILILPVCRTCSSVQYPPREVCVNCLGDKLEWHEVPGHGEVLATTVQHYSLDEKFRLQLPLHTASVKLDAGPVAIVFAGPGLKPGQKVSVSIRQSGAEEPVLQAMPMTGGAA